MESLKRLEARSVIQHGYSVADATMCTLVTLGTAPPSALPDV
ncbi:hypothetical protein [Hyphomonas oceanitis]|nr:hypothetical protein [Hyphomonas oceanitis]